MIRLTMTFMGTEWNKDCGGIGMAVSAIQTALENAEKSRTLTAITVTYHPGDSLSTQPGERITVGIERDRSAGR